MNNALRITLIVFVLLVLVLISGTLYKNQNQKKITAVTSKIADYDKKIQKIDEEFAQSLELKKELNRIQNEVDKFDKSIQKYDSPPVTYDYLLNILSMMKDDLIFNFTYSGQKQETGMISNSYLIKGAASLGQVYKLIANLEKQKTIYYVYNLAISAPEITASDTINYSFMIDSISEQAVPQKVNQELKKISTNQKVGKLFTCGLLEEKLAAERALKRRNLGLLNLSSLNLIAIRGDEAIFRDNQGILQILTSGDRVKDGSLTEIDEENGTVKFMIDMGNGKKEERVFNIGSGGKQ